MRPARLRAFRGRLRTVAVVAALAVTALAGCAGTTVEPVPVGSASSAANDPADDARYAAFYHQTITWHPCDSGFRCGTVTVPVDWSAPAGRTLTLAVTKLPASGHRIGSLLVNPGGPGVSGVDFAQSAKSFFSSSVRAAFDVVGWDPRGVGGSSAVDCVSDATLDTLISEDGTPDTAAERKASVTDFEAFGRACIAKNGDLIKHLDTVSTARDLDVLRAAVGDTKLSYYGASYGTYIGAWYAQLFPWRVGRLVLDGAVDPSLSVEQFTEGQAQGFATGMKAFVTDCLASSGCALRGDAATGIATLQRLADLADAHPLTTSDPDRPLTQALLLTGLAMGMYSESLWPDLRTAVASALQGDGSGLLALADMYNERSDNGTYSSVYESNVATYCLDHRDTESITQIAAVAQRLRTSYPPLGDSIGWGLLGCSVWPVAAVVPAQRLTAAGAAPIVVIGTTGDPATPYAWARSLASQLSSGVLLTREGSGHAAYDSGNDCIDTTVDDYLVTGAVPQDGKVCS